MLFPRKGWILQEDEWQVCKAGAYLHTDALATSPISWTFFFQEQAARRWNCGREKWSCLWTTRGPRWGWSQTRLCSAFSTGSKPSEWLPNQLSRYQIHKAIQLRNYKILRYTNILKKNTVKFSPMLEKIPEIGLRHLATLQHEQAVGRCPAT